MCICMIYYALFLDIQLQYLTMQKKIKWLFLSNKIIIFAKYITHQRTINQILIKN